MTCVVGIINKDKKVYIGSDSAGTSVLSYNIRKDSKVFRNKKFLFGCTSSFRMIQLLRYSFSPPKRKGKEIYEYLCTDFIDAVRKCFDKGGYLQKYTEGDEKGGTFIIAYKGRLFTIYEDFQVAENIRPYVSIGCGSEFALGALSVLIKTSKKTSTVIKEALVAAVDNSVGVKPPFVIKSL